MKSALLRHDARPPCHKHRERAALPAPVIAPLTAGAITVGGAGLAARRLGVSAFGVLLVMLVVAVVAALAVHRTISSLAVGAGILLAQPYRPGDRVRVYVPLLCRTVDAEVVRVGAANTTLLVRYTDGTPSGAAGLVAVPNNRMLRSGGS